MTITELVKESYDITEEKGFHQEPINIGEKLMLIVSELSEALEAHRSRRLIAKEHQRLLEFYIDDITTVGNKEFEIFIKDSFEDELADVIIRIGDLCGLLDIDLESHVKAKLKYNQSRPHKHDKRY